ncbi:hypothetical protein [Hespellia stercorisuis]|uniref:hypothetical protein n=1 Tax=Hespellia stercorisuis TaxID=180311 RepID=UPI00135668CD|nr:hypothetical protein [Hespellia stercorisuis]
MKSFNDFWTSLSEDELASMADIATERAASVSTDNPKRCVRYTDRCCKHNDDHAASQ